MSRIKRELDESDQEHQSTKQRIINRLTKAITTLNEQLERARMEIAELKREKNKK